jgi:hypothetical protein
VDDLGIDPTPLALHLWGGCIDTENVDDLGLSGVAMRFVLTSSVASFAATGVLLVATTGAGLPATAPEEAAPLVVATCLGERVTIRGTPGADHIVGTARRDVIYAGAGSDLVRSRRGGDLICAGRGGDVVRSRHGNDRVRGGPGRDVLRLGGRDDAARGGHGHDRIFFGPGDDRMDFGLLRAGTTKLGGAGDDLIRGGPGGDWISGGAGSDDLFGGPGADEIGDLIFGALTYGHITLAGSDEIVAGRGSDRVFGSRGPTYAFGGLGRDFISGGPSDDFLDGGPGSRDSAYGGGHQSGDRCVRVEFQRACELR